jgi:hypothetical protein
MGLLLLQSYSPDALSTAVRFAGGAVFVDAETRETIAAAANGSVTLAFPADYGTRLVYVLARAGQPPLLPNTKDTVLVDDFELGLGYRLGVSSGGFEVAPDNRLPANHVLRVRAGHPAQNLLRPQAVTLPGDHELSFRFRLPEVPEKIGKSGLLTIGYRDADKRRYHFGLGFQRGNDSTARWTVSAPLLVYDGGRNEGYQTPAAAPVAADQPFTADGEWHTITIRVKGSSHDIRLDGRPVFAGSDDRNLTGGFVIAPGWGWELPVPFVELDDIRVEALR